MLTRSMNGIIYVVRQEKRRKQRERNEQSKKTEKFRHHLIALRTESKNVQTARM
jgi:hypothetical protein